MPLLRVILATLLVSPACCLGASGGLDIVEEFISTMTEDMLEDSKIEFRPELLESGMAESDVDRILNKLAVDTIECVMDELADYAEEHSTDVKSLVTPDDEGGVFAINIVIGSNSLHICTISALEKAGLALD